MALFEEYKNHQDKFVRERANNWAIAIGLQRVDELSVSDFLIPWLAANCNSPIGWWSFEFTNSAPMVQNCKELRINIQQKCTNY